MFTLPPVYEPTIIADSIIKGCTLNIIIDNKLLCIRDDKFRFVPRDDLVEGIRDRAGAQSVRIGYV